MIFGFGGWKEKSAISRLCRFATIFIFPPSSLEQKNQSSNRKQELVSSVLFMECVISSSALDLPWALLTSWKPTFFLPPPPPPPPPFPPLINKRRSNRVKEGELVILNLS